MNRYYLVNLVGATLTPALNLLPPVPGRREEPHDLAHWRTSVDGTLAILQAETNTAEHAALLALSLPSVSTLGTFDVATGRASQPVYDYLANNAAIWRGSGA